MSLRDRQDVAAVQCVKQFWSRTLAQRAPNLPKLLSAQQLPFSKDQWWSEWLRRTFRATLVVAGQLMHLADSASQHRCGGCCYARGNSEAEQLAQRAATLTSLQAHISNGSVAGAHKASAISRTCWGRRRITPTVPPNMPICTHRTAQAGSHQSAAARLAPVTAPREGEPWTDRHCAARVQKPWASHRGLQGAPRTSLSQNGYGYNITIL